MEEEKEDRFASIIKFCKPTVSQEAKLRNCPLARESENFLDSNPDPLMSSPESTQPEPIRIVLVSLPDSRDNSADRNSPREDDAVFHTPPEEQNPDESSSDGARSVDLNARFGKQKRVGTSEGEMDDDLISKKIKVWEELNGDTVPIDDTEMITTELDENQGERTLPETVDVLITDSGDDSLEKIIEDVLRDAKQVEQRKLEETGGVVENCVHKFDASNESGELMTCEYAENVKMNKDEMPHKNGTSYGTLGGSKAVGNGCVEKRDNGVDGDEEFDNITKDENAIKQTCEDAGWRIASKNIEDIDKFRYVGDRDNGGHINKRVGAIGGGVGRKRKLPISIKGKEKNVGGGDVTANTVGTKTQLLKDFLNAFNLVVGPAGDGCDDKDFLEIAKSRGMTFPRPRWWPSESDGDL
ncbi:uncharacterized protein LOC142527916 [Primulina tabacum]|uniref:uncharacterized protein LOC142527916 n=1 Tax=Primulina tabacum TaxID=48773 RepID=UPI003F5908D3